MDAAGRGSMLPIITFPAPAAAIASFTGSVASAVSSFLVVSFLVIMPVETVFTLEWKRGNSFAQTPIQIHFHHFRDVGSNRDVH